MIEAWLNTKLVGQWWPVIALSWNEIVNINISQKVNSKVNKFPSYNWTERYFLIRLLAFAVLGLSFLALLGVSKKRTKNNEKILPFLTNWKYLKISIRHCCLLLGQSWRYHRGSLNCWGWIGSTSTVLIFSKQSKHVSHFHSKNLILPLKFW